MKRPIALPSYLVLAAVLLLAIPTARAFDPAPGTPLALDQHPRLHVTVDTMPAIRAAISAHYLSEYQQWIDWAAGEWDNPGTLDEYRHETLRAPIAAWAFIGLVGDIPGITYPKTPHEFARHAIESMNDLLPGSDEIAFHAAIVYDWAYSAMTAGERQSFKTAFAGKKIGGKSSNQQSIQDPLPSDIDSDNLTSSKYYESCYAFYIALACWQPEDGSTGSAFDRSVDSFYHLMLDYGRLDAIKLMAGVDGGLNEMYSYAGWHLPLHYLLVDGWRTATGENFFVDDPNIEGGAARTLVELLLFHLDPHPYNGGAAFTSIGGGNSDGGDFVIQQFRTQLNLLPRILAESGETVRAGLHRWYADSFGLGFPRYEDDWLWAFLGILRAYDPITPDEAGMAHTRWFENMGRFIARTGFADPGDSVFTVTDAHFDWAGHKGFDDHPGFSLTRFGDLVSTREVSTKGHGNINDYPQGYSNNVVFMEGAGSSPERTARQQVGLRSEIEDAATAALGSDGAYLDNGGIEQVTRREGVFHHVRCNRDRSFTVPEKPAIDSDMGRSHTRDYVWLPHSVGDDLEADYLVIYDRVEVAGAGVTPRWTYHVPFRPDVNGAGPIDISTGSGETGRSGTAYDNADLVTIHNRPRPGDFAANTEWGVHGIAFSRSLLPEAARIEISRVTDFNSRSSSVMGGWELKPMVWQVGVLPSTGATEHRFLHVFEVGDEDVFSSMTPTGILRSSDGVMEGSWITGRGSHPNFVVLFNHDIDVFDDDFSYELTGTGAVRHVIVGVPPGRHLEITDGATTLQRDSETNVELWDYRGVAANNESGVLFFETTATGAHTIRVRDTGPTHKLFQDDFESGATNNWSRTIGG